MSKFLFTMTLILAATAADEMQRFNETDGETRVLLERMADAMGGVHALSRINTVRSFAKIEQKHREEEDPIAIELLSSFPGKHRARILTEQGTMTITVNKDDAYILPAQPVIKGAAIRLTDQEKDDLLHYFNIDPVFVARNLRQSDYRFAAGSRMTIGDLECQELKVDVNGMESSWWIDLASGRVIRSTFRDRQMDFSDFRTVGDIEVPFEVVTRLGDEVVSRTAIARYDVNPAIDVRILFRTPDLWLARFSLPERKRNPYQYYSRFSSYSGSSYSSSSYSGYTYRPPRVATRDPGTVIWDSRASLVH